MAGYVLYQQYSRGKRLWKEMGNLGMRQRARTNSNKSLYHRARFSAKPSMPYALKYLFHVLYVKHEVLESGVAQALLSKLSSVRASLALEIIRTRSENYWS